ncbi:hypothetical protein PENTCL1PPCAC_22727, partial [Pristionchus entomophagus]
TPVTHHSSLQMASAAGWQLLSVSIHRDPVSRSLGIAVSGGIDNPLFTSGEGTVVISDVVPNGPASGLLQLNDRILSANGISFESIAYSRAVEVIKQAQHINMIVKRRVPVPVMEFEQRTLKFTLTKSRKKDDFGIVLGCKFYIKEITNAKLAEKDPGLREGDTVLRVNGQSLDGVTLDEAAKWLEKSREKLCLVIQRDVRRGASRWPSTQTVYERVGSVGATPRHSPSPLMHVPLSARSSHEYINNGSHKGDLGGLEGRMATHSPMIASSHGSTNYHYDYHMSAMPDERGQRTVCFHKVGGSVGIRVVGGNEVGIFVSAVAADSQASRHGICPGDRILEVNGRSMAGVTREMAVQTLMGLEERVILRLEYASSHLEYVRQSQIGDNFFVRAHFNKEKKGGGLELAINEGDIYHVTDTLYGGNMAIGWQASRVYSSSGKGDTSKGVIPNQNNANNFLREMRRNNEERENKSRSTLLRRKLESRRTKSLTKNVMGGGGDSQWIPAYERVVLTCPSFPRPVILLGPLSDVARRLLLSQFALLFSSPSGEGEGVIRLPAIDAIIANNKHALLDITLDSVERLQLAQYAPIVILIDVESRWRLREIRKKMEAPRISSKLLAEHASAIKKNHSHLLSATVDASQEEGWLDAVKDLISHLQMRRLWMPEFPCAFPLEDMLLFTNTRNEKDSDSERDRSIHHDYIEYSDNVNKSIYQWDATRNPLLIPSNGGEIGWNSMKRGERGERREDHSSHSQLNIPSMSTQRSWNEYDGSLRREVVGGRDQSREMKEMREMDKRKGYYNVQQLLKPEQESKVVSDLGNITIDGRRDEEEKISELKEEKISELKWRMKEVRRDDGMMEGKKSNDRNNVNGGVETRMVYSCDSSPPIPNSSSGVSSEGKSEKSHGGKPAIPPKTLVKENNNVSERNRRMKSELID